MNQIYFAIPSIILIGTANAILKWRIGYLNSEGIGIFTKKAILFFCDPFIVVGAIATAASVARWLYIAGFVKISIVYPVIQAGAISVTVLLGVLLLGEKLISTQFVGLSFIIVGIIFLSARN